MPLLRPLPDLVHSIQDCAFHRGPGGVCRFQSLLGVGHPAPGGVSGLMDQNRRLAGADGVTLMQIVLETLGHLR